MSKYLVLISFFIMVLTLIPVSITDAQSYTQAGLVIRFSDNDVQTFCIPFEGDSISGIELLEKSKLQIGIKYSGEGQAV